MTGPLADDPEPLDDPLEPLEEEVLLELLDDDEPLEPLELEILELLEPPELLELLEPLEALTLGGAAPVLEALPDAELAPLVVPTEFD